MVDIKGFREGCEELQCWCNDRRAYAPELANELDKTLKVCFSLHLLNARIWKIRMRSKSMV